MGARGEGTSGAPPRSGFLLLLLLLAVVSLALGTTHAHTPPHAHTFNPHVHVLSSTSARGLNARSQTLLRALLPRHTNATVSKVTFRGARSALAPPTVTSASPPNRNSNRQHPSQRLQYPGSSSSNMPPVVASRAPSSANTHHRPYWPGEAPLATAASGSRAFGGATARTHYQLPAMGLDAWDRHPPPVAAAAGGDDTDFGFVEGTASEPEKWSQRQPAPPGAPEGDGGGRGGGWAERNIATVEGGGKRKGWGRVVEGTGSGLFGLGHQPPPDAPHRPPYSEGRSDTFGLKITEDLSHLDDSRPWTRNGEGAAGGAGGGRASHTVFEGGYRPDIEGTGRQGQEETSISDFESIVPSEYQPEDYNTYHEYDHGHHPFSPPQEDAGRHPFSPPQEDAGRHPFSPPEEGAPPLTVQHVVYIHNLTTQADLHALLEQRGVTFDQLRAFLDSGATEEEVVEFLSPPSSTTTTTAPTTGFTAPPQPSRDLDLTAAEEGYQGDTAGEGLPPSTRPEGGRSGNTQGNRGEQRRGNRKKGRKGGRQRKNRMRGRKRQRVKQESSETATPTLRSLPSTTTTTPHYGIPLPVTPTHTMNSSSATSPLSTRIIDASIVSVTVGTAPVGWVPGQDDTVAETASPSRKHTTRHKPPADPSRHHPWEKLDAGEAARPLSPWPPLQTTSEVEHVNFVREQQSYVFPVKGLLIISGLMGALAVFTLVVLISYAVIKCSKKPVVNNYQVSEQKSAVA